MDAEERKKLDELHDFFLKPPGPKRPTRAEQIDKLLVALNAGKLGTRAFMFICALVITVGSALAALKGWGIK